VGVSKSLLDIDNNCCFNSVSFMKNVVLLCYMSCYFTSACFADE
jgi:hypothetical protein